MFLVNGKHSLPHAQQVSTEYSYFTILSKDTTCTVRSILHRMLNNTTRKYYSLAFILMVNIPHSKLQSFLLQSILNTTKGKYPLLAFIKMVIIWDFIHSHAQFRATLHSIPNSITGKCSSKAWQTAPQESILRQTFFEWLLFGN